MLKAITVGATGAAAGSTASLEAMAAALADDAAAPPLLWISDGNNDQNHLTLLGQRAPSFLRLVSVVWDVREYGPILPTGYKLPISPYAKAPVLVLETVPRGSNPDSAVADKIKQLIPQAKAAILLGTDACYGGPGIDEKDIARFEAQCKAAKTPIIKLPGIPVPPHHLLGVISYLESFGFPRLDGSHRPLLYYSETVCRDCEHRDELETGRFAKEFGEAGCLLRLGCKGPITHNSCSKTRWNDGENWCVGAGGPCTGCSEPGFPDHGGLGLYGAINGAPAQQHSAMLQNVENFGIGLAALAAVGIGLRLVRNALAPHEEPADRSSGGKEKGNG
jgi:Ni,Fe-hydrogenase I small subunit